MCLFGHVTERENKMTVEICFTWQKQRLIKLISDKENIYAILSYYGNIDINKYIFSLSLFASCVYVIILRYLVESTFR